MGDIADIVEHRQGPDRRRQPRGGRRTNDSDGVAPLVLLVGAKPDVVNSAEAVLAKLRFAVATSTSTDEALKVVTGLRPDIVVAGEADAPEIRRRAPQGLPVVVMDGAMRDNPESLINEIRRTLRKRKDH